MSKLKDISNTALSLMYPARCPYCRDIMDNDREYACEKCKEEIIDQGLFRNITDGYLCSSVMQYEGKPKYAVLNYKFKNKEHYAKQFAILMAQHIKKHYEDVVFDYITYVPMHKFSLFLRGYNQSERLARELSEILKVPCCELICKKKFTRPQHKIKKVAKRRKNLKGAFDLTDKRLIKNKQILLIDDIVTTGSTLFECIKLLRKAKCANIYCCTMLSVID